MRIFIFKDVAVNVDNNDDAEALITQGARELTGEEIAAAGMKGYEHLVGPDTVTVGDDGRITFTPPVVDLAQAKAAKLAEINAACDAALASLTADYPESELLTFDKQETEARALIADPEAATPFLTPLAAARGLETEALARKVIAKADAFTTASGHVIGLRQKDEDRLKAAQSVEDVAAIVPEYRLPEAK